MEQNTLERVFTNKLQLKTFKDNDQKNIKKIPEEKKCNKCGDEKPISEFPKDKTKSSGHRSICKTCTKKSSAKKSNQFELKIRKLFSDAKSTYDKNHKYQREGIFNLTPEFMFNLWKIQNGKCFYSNIPMNYDDYCWTVSLERLNTQKTYMQDNVVLCALEFNNQANFSEEKMTDLVPNVELSEQFTIPSIKDIKNQKENFYYHMHNLKYDCELRNNKFKNSSCESKKVYYDITLDFLLELYEKQNGKCYYSKIPMRCGTRENYWTMSVERLDSRIGYCRENICLICLEFNAPDRSSIHEEILPHEKRTNWSKDKFKYFYDTFKTHPYYQKGLEKMKKYDTKIKLDLVISECKRCGEKFEREAKTSYKTFCKQCLSTKNIEKRKRLEASGKILTRECTKCKKSFPLNDKYFYENCQSSLGLHTICKKCKS